MLETAGVSQPVAAELLGVSDRTIRRWATGETQIPEGTVEKLRLALLAPIEEEPDVFARMSDAIIPHEAKYRVDAEALAALRNWDTSLHSRRADARTLRPMSAEVFEK